MHRPHRQQPIGPGLVNAYRPTGSWRGRAPRASCGCSGNRVSPPPASLRRRWAKRARSLPTTRRRGDQETGASRSGCGRWWSRSRPPQGRPFVDPNVRPVKGLPLRTDGSKDPDPVHSRIFQPPRRTYHARSEVDPCQWGIYPPPPGAHETNGRSAHVEANGLGHLPAARMHARRRGDGEHRRHPEGACASDPSSCQPRRLRRWDSRRSAAPCRHRPSSTACGRSDFRVQGFQNLPLALMRGPSRPWSRR